MPKYKITAPDGKVLTINAPEGATHEQVLAYAQQNYKPQNANDSEFARMITGKPAAPQAPDPTTGMSTMDRLRAGFGKSMVDTARGLGQLATNNARRATGAIEQLNDRFGNDLSRRIAGGLDDIVASSQQRQQSAVDEARERDAPLMNTGAGLGGNIAGTVAQAVAMPGVGTGGALGRMAMSAGQGATFAGSQPVATGESRVDNMALGGAFGAGGQAAVSAVTRAGKGLSDKLSPHVMAVYERAQQAGIPVHFSQLSDSRFVKTLASAVGYLPFSGSGKKASQQQEAFNRAMGRSFGVDDAPNLSDDVMQAARRRLGASYDDIYSRNVVKADEEFVGDLASIERSAMRNLPPDEQIIVKNQIDDILAEAGDTGMPGAQYQAFRTDRLLPLEGGQKTFQAGLIKDIRKALDRAAERSVGPDDARSLAITRRQYRNMKTVEKAMGQVEGSKGNVRPASLWPIVNQKGGSTSEMRELARIGQAIKDPIPDSGTAGRMLTYGLLGGAGGAGAMSGNDNLQGLGNLLLLGATAGRAANSGLLANYLARGSRPIEGMSRLLAPAPRALPAAGLPFMAAPSGEEIALAEELARRRR